MMVIHGILFGRALRGFRAEVGSETIKDGERRLSKIASL